LHKCGSSYKKCGVIYAAANYRVDADNKHALLLTGNTVQQLQCVVQLIATSLHRA
jgi:hypothetical protein